jgi:hypothetical protein
MPALRNQRQEMFCLMMYEGRKHGWPPHVCYTKAGYKATKHAAEVAASRLLKKAEIIARQAELSAPAVRKTKTTVDSLALQFDQVFEGAIGSEQFGAAGAAAAAKAKLFGFMREKIEVGAPGEFDKCETAEQVVEKVLQDQTPQQALEVLDILRTLVEQRAGDLALVVEQPKPSPIDTASAALRLYTPVGKTRR